MRPPTKSTEHDLHPLPRDQRGGGDARFQGRLTAGSGNYTEEREALFRDLSLDDILAEIRGASPTESA
jgi:hypothetical protein